MNKMTEKERYKRSAENFGLEVTEIGNTLQWVTAGTKETVINFFTPSGEWIKTEIH